MTEAGPEHASRRTLLKTAGTAAWTTPVIITATAAPSTAATGGASVSVSVVPHVLSATSESYDITFDNTGPATEDFYFTLSLSRTSPTGGLTTVSAPSGGFSTADSAANGDTVTLTFTRDGGVLPAGLTTTGLVVEADDGYAANVSITAYPTPGVGGATGTTFDTSGAVTVSVSAVPHVISGTSVSYDISFDNSGSATTSFEFTLSLTQTSASGGLTSVSSPSGGFSSTGSDSAADTITLRYTRDGGVLPTGSTTTSLTVEADGDYAADVVVTAYPSPGAGGSGSSTFDTSGVPRVSVSVVPHVLSATLESYDITFRNTGAETTSFDFTLSLTQTSASGGLSVVSAPSGDFSSAGSDSAGNTVILTYTRDGGVLPMGSTTTSLTVEAYGDYTADVVVTAAPTPGSGGSTTSSFDTAGG